MIPYRFCFKSKAKGNFLIFETMLDIFWILDFCKYYYLKIKRIIDIKQLLMTAYSFELCHWVLQEGQCHNEERANYEALPAYLVSHRPRLIISLLLDRPWQQDRVLACKWLWLTEFSLSWSRHLYEQLHLWNQLAQTAEHQWSQLTKPETFECTSLSFHSHFSYWLQSTSVTKTA